MQAPSKPSGRVTIPVFSLVFFHLTLFARHGLSARAICSQAGFRICKLFCGVVSHSTLFARHGLFACAICTQAGFRICKLKLSIQSQNKQACQGHCCTCEKLLSYCAGDVVHLTGNMMLKRHQLQHLSTNKVKRAVFVGQKLGL